MQMAAAFLMTLAFILLPAMPAKAAADTVTNVPVPAANPIFTVTGGKAGDDYSFYNNTLWLTPNEPLEISMAPGVSNTAASIKEDTSSGSKNITVTLNDIHLSGDGSMFYLGSGTNTVVLKGNSDIENTHGGTQGVFYSNGPLTIKGTGSLTLTDSTSDVSAVQCGDALQIGTDTDAPHITVTNTQGTCIGGGFSDSSISISGGKIDCSGVRAINSAGSVSISGGMLKLTSDYSEIQGNTVSITGGLFADGDPAGVIETMPRGRITADKTPDEGHYVFINTDAATKDTYPVRVAEGFMITLDQQGATVSGTTSVPSEKGSLILPDIPDIQYRPSKTKCRFGGYYAGTDGSGKQYYNADGTPAAKNDLTQDTTLYAYWMEDSVPVFTTQPSDQVVDKGDTATFTVAASGIPAPDFYQWEYKLAGTDKWLIVMEGSGRNDTTYTTPKTKPIMDGCLYRCRAHNYVGSTYSEPAKLSIRMAVHLDPGTDYTFRSEEEGYTAQEVLTENVINDGGQSTGKLQISLSGQDSSAFELSTTEIEDISLGGSTDFSVQPKSGLSAGTYTATVTVSGTGIPDRSFNVSFTVSTGYTITLDQHEITMEAGDSWHLNATVTPSSAASLQIVWGYSDDRIATVDDNGNVKAIAEGEAEIAAILFDNNVRKAIDTCKVTVKPSSGPGKDIPSGTVGKEYSVTLKADGTGPFTWSLESGSLPDGLTIDGDTGVISGTPAAKGTYTFTVKATDSTGAVTEIPVTITVAAKTADVTPAPAAPVCTHPNIAWETTKEATATDDGEIAYRCPDCGYVEQRLPVSGYTVFIANACRSIKDAKANATVKITTDRWMSFHRSVIEQLAKRPDVTVDLTYRYKGKNYGITIPAGTDLGSCLDKNGYIGFLYLAARPGVTQSAK
jgi:hypothetical protein